MRRIDAGYIRWTNPWSGKPVFVSFEKARLFVFWSKNPAPFLRFLPELDRRGYHYYFLVTLNDYEKEGLEKGVPGLQERIETFSTLSRSIGRDRVLWRFDPLCITDTLSCDELLARIERIGGKIAGRTGRLIFSFIAEYAKVRKNLEAAGIRLVKWQPAEKDSIVKEIANRCSSWGISAVTCAEVDDYSKHGVEHGKCIDDRLISRLFSNDDNLMEFLRQGGKEKDKGQRPACGCCMSKDIGSYNTCPHFCTYCYANFSSDMVRRHSSIWNSRSDSLAV